MSIELQTGAGCLVSDASDSELYAGIEGDGNYILRKPLELSMADSNTLVVGSGTGLQNGRHIRFKGETSFTIPSGVQAQKRSHIAVVRTSVDYDENLNTKVRSEPIVLTGDPVSEGEPSDPVWIEGNLLAGDTVADFPIARVVTDGINVNDPEPMFEVLQSQKDFRDSQSQWSEINTGITGLTCRVNPATREGYLSFDAVAISNYGYEHDINLPTEYHPKEIFSTTLYCSDNGVTGWARIKPSGKVQYVNLAYNDHAYGQLRWNL